MSNLNQSEHDSVDVFKHLVTCGMKYISMSITPVIFDDKVMFKTTFLKRREDGDIDVIDATDYPEDFPEELKEKKVIKIDGASVPKTPFNN